jgi:hypothetical protein
MSAQATEAEIDAFVKKLRFQQRTFRDQYSRPYYVQASSTVHIPFALEEDSFPCVYITGFQNEAGTMVNVSPPIMVRFPPVYFIGNTIPHGDSVPLAIVPHYRLCRMEKHQSAKEHGHNRPTVMNMFQSENGAYFAKPTESYKTSEFFQILKTCTLQGGNEHLTLYAEPPNVRA